ncbi:MAG: hypothetical protein H7Z37_00690 [Pyrinomonadaceae bacterium]|nr:hypothetical protein [Pyrinomonadaceae bacterium]
MTTTKLFRLIWRINAVIVLAVGIVVTGFMIAGLAVFVKEQLRTSNNNTIKVRTDENAIVKTELKYGKFSKVAGANYMVASIQAKQDYSNYGIANSKEQTNVAFSNCVFVNLADDSTGFLLPHNDSLIVYHEAVTKESKTLTNDDEIAPTLLFSYRIVKNDTNNDGRLNLDDKKTIAFSDISGANLTDIITNVDEVLNTERLNDNTMIYIYRANEKIFISGVNLAERKVVSTKELPQLN